MKAISSTALIELSLDLASSLTSNDRFDQLLTTLRKAITCEAVAVLAVQGEFLVPLAQQGLSSDTLGRRFVVTEHPRFEQICQSLKPVRFPADCPLPDPYDGLLIDREGDLPVHACMGLPLYFDQQLIGVLTLDSLTPNIFDDLPNRTLEVISALAAVSLNTALTIELLETNVHHSQQVMAALSQANALVEQNQLLGQSPVMTKLKQEVGLVAPSDYTVLISGESGTGKELIAHSIHQQSRRNQQPIIYVNCAALPENLIESELFGHVKGAFTGADSNRLGKFAIADGGTLFLDEVGELPLVAQSKLLRALQSNEIQAVGQDQVTKVDVRVIAATNRDLATEVQADRFRADLYHRLNVYPIQVPALRERQGDIELLAGFFVEKLRRKLGLQQLKLSDQVLVALQQYQWPGNVRELEHMLSRAALKASSGTAPKTIVSISIADCDLMAESALHAVTTAGELSAENKNTGELLSIDQPINLRIASDNFQRRLIRQALTQANGNWSAAAKLLEMDRANLTRLAKRLGVQVEKVVR
ncbi:nitric oxide reductase transcriptional regulator NorR [Endozoicomonas sp. G2_1]|uniref:nitric oxide reductase transcriptional regulator NorR n=1 Tax=Endozoicomonas sp. G2_1 TaxID=2821091 RepID=UPI001AD9B127|nr:nitric oxide reductase transcriptional regulator NorR [Endozoicomonas sp. G2_1]MBO9490919.1 nitric oxide reductase transcriptional regulator NorR [Endozoicomonas sp. G2_1]